MCWLASTVFPHLLWADLPSEQNRTKTNKQTNRKATLSISKNKKTIQESLTINKNAGSRIIDHRSLKRLLLSHTWFRSPEKHLTAGGVADQVGPVGFDRSTGSARPRWRNSQLIKTRDSNIRWHHWGRLKTSVNAGQVSTDVTHLYKTEHMCLYNPFLCNLFFIFVFYLFYFPSCPCSLHSPV